MTDWLWPKMLHAQWDDRARAIADTLLVISAERSYAQRNCGYPSEILRLGQGWIGIPNYWPDEPFFLPPRLAAPGPHLEFGYIRNFTPSVGSPVLTVECDPESVFDFCYASEPFDPSSGLPSFSGTWSGDIYVDPTGSRIPCPVPRGTRKLALPGITSPTPGSALPGSSVTVQWRENDVPVREWRLTAGSTPWVANYYDSGPIWTGSSTTVTNLPLDGSAVSFRLSYRVADFSGHSDAVYVAATSAGGTPTITNPAPGSKLPGSSATFQWSANGASVTEWWLYVGSSRGARNYFDSLSLGTKLSVIVNGLPTNGSGVWVHVRLWYRVAGLWRYSDLVYTPSGS